MKTRKKPRYWLLKSEPDCFSLTDLERSPKQVTVWDGVRNYQARNFMRDDMQPGDLAFFYHSSCKIPAIVGTVTITKVGIADITALDPKSEYYDPKATPMEPRWYTVQVQFKERFADPVTLQALRQERDLADMALLQRGNRLSILPITPSQWETVKELTCHQLKTP